MAFCPNCGNPVEGQFCAKCGARIGAPATPPPQSQASGPAGPPVYQPPAAPASAPAPKKKGPLFWVLTGCLGLIVIGGIIAVLLGVFVYQKAKQAGFDPELMQKNPGVAVAKMMAAMNPDIEILGVDEDRGIIRVRNKKDGKTLTMDLAEAKKGKIVFLDEKNQKLEIQAQGEGDKASLEVRGPGGTMRVGGPVQLPDWLPAYSGAQALGAFGANTEQGNAATYGFKTNDSVEKVVSFYEDALKKAGLEVEKTEQEAGGQGPSIMLLATDNAQRTAHVMVMRTPEGTTVNISFEGKK